MICFHESPVLKREAMGIVGNSDGVQSEEDLAL